MLESYEVGVSLKMTTDVTGVLDRLLRDLEAFNRLVKETRDSLGGLARDLGSLSIDRMAEATRQAVSSSEQLGRVMADNARAASDTATAMERASRAASSGASSGRRSSSRGGHGGLGGHDLMMTGLAATMLGEPLMQTTDSALGRAIAVGHLRTQMLADRRVSPAQADEAINRAYAATNSAPGTTVLENTAAIIDLKNVTGSLQEAERMLPQFAQLSALLSVMDRRKGGSGDPAYAAAKAMEIMGQMIETHVDPKTGKTVRELDPDLLTKHLDMMARVAVATNMRVEPQTYLSYAKTARAAGMTVSDDFTYGFLPALLQTTGGPRIGTSLMSMFQVFAGGHMTGKTYDALAEIGLASRGGHRRVRNPRTGRMEDKIDTAGIYDLPLLLTNPALAMQDMQARMEKAGIHGTDKQIIALMKASQRSTIAGLFADLLKDMPSILKERENIQNTNPNVTTLFAQQDPAAKMQQFEASWDKFLTSFGTAALGDAIALLDKVTGGLNYLGDWAKAHPDEARVVTDAAAGLGAIAIGVGALSTAVFLFGPALKLLRSEDLVKGADAAAALGGSAGKAGSLLGVAAGLTGLATVATGLGLVLGNLAHDFDETHEWARKLDDEVRGVLRRGLHLDPPLPAEPRNYTPHPWPGVPAGPPASHSSYFAPDHARAPVQQINLILDGRRIAGVTLDRLGRALDTPHQGMTGFDGSMSRAYPGDLLNT